jgi:hypothetical protein
MQCSHPIYLKTKNGKGFYVPCGVCIGCRLAKTREWALRIVHELDYWKDGSFITLTYDDDNLPMNGSLVKSDLQKYFKRLRYSLDKEKRNIKYYACGEYGENLFRPHYHAIILGLHPVKDYDLIHENWNYGFVYIGSVTYDSAKYVTGYIQKKYNGEKAKETYGSNEPPFQLVSKGIGKRFCEDNADQIVDNGSITFHGKHYSLPKYYRTLLDIDKNDVQVKALREHKKVVEYWQERGFDSEKKVDLIAVPEALEQHGKTLTVRTSRSKKGIM